MYQSVSLRVDVLQCPRTYSGPRPGCLVRALRAAGLCRGRRGPRSRPLFGWASLTPAEQAVASLVADRTDQPADRRAAVHLAADRADPPGYVFAKLDIACRAQLAAQVTRHRL
jgi:hypothetical protein